MAFSALHCENPTCPLARRPWRRLLPGVQRISLQQRWHCDLDCFEQGIAQLLRQHLASPPRPRVQAHRIPLGLVLLERGIIDDETLRNTLQKQQDAGQGRIGDWLRRVANLSEREITQGLGLQWACPVFPLTDSKMCVALAGLVPLAPLLASCMVPLHYQPATRYLYMGFGDGVDYAALYGVEQMLDCRAEACVANETQVRRALEELRLCQRPPEVTFEHLLDVEEMVRATRDYVLRTGARQVRLVRCGDFLWVRLGSEPLTDLLFRVPGAESLPPPAAKARARFADGSDGHQNT